MDAMKRFIETNYCLCFIWELIDLLCRAWIKIFDSLKDLASPCRKMCVNLNVSLERWSHCHKDYLKFVKIRQQRIEIIKKETNRNFITAISFLYETKIKQNNTNDDEVTICVNVIVMRGKMLMIRHLRSDCSRNNSNN